MKVTLRVKKLNEWANLPTIATPGEDLGYDLYASEDIRLLPSQVHKVKTGISLSGTNHITPVGFLVRDRSSMASKGVFTHGGVIDAGYRGEMLVMMTSLAPYQILSGDKIAQIIPVVPSAGDVEEVTALPSSLRGENGFGSSGR